MQTILRWWKRKDSRILRSPMAKELSIVRKISSELWFVRLLPALLILITHFVHLLTFVCHFRIDPSYNSMIVLNNLKKIHTFANYEMSESFKSIIVHSMKSMKYHFPAKTKWLGVRGKTFSECHEYASKQIISLPTIASATWAGDETHFLS
jgi:hypothetical protein